MCAVLDEIYSSLLGTAPPWRGADAQGERAIREQPSWPQLVNGVPR
jgi:hypothetical protein